MTLLSIEPGMPLPAAACVATLQRSRVTVPHPLAHEDEVAPTIARIKVSLRHIRPSIWRRIEIRADAKLIELHRLLQVAMGWTDSHLHQFEQHGIYYGQSDPEFGLRRVSERRALVQDLLREPKDRLRYDYDFGDSWEHDVVLEAFTDAEPGVRYPRVVGGKRACPPEDVGGVPGYADFLEAIADPAHPEHAEWVEWVGARFDPEDFDVEAANGGLRGRKILVPADA